MTGVKLPSVQQCHVLKLAWYQKPVCFPDLLGPQMFSKPLVRKLMKGVIVLELLGVFGAYSLFHMMNSSQGNTDEAINT